MKVNEIILDDWFYLEELPLVRLNITKKKKQKKNRYYKIISVSFLWVN